MVNYKEVTNEKLISSERGDVKIKIVNSNTSTSAVVF